MTPPKQAPGRIMSAKNTYTIIYSAFPPYGISYSLIMLLQSGPGQFSAIFIRRFAGPKGEGQHVAAACLLSLGQG